MKLYIYVVLSSPWPCSFLCNCLIWWFLIFWQYPFFADIVLAFLTTCIFVFIAVDDQTCMDYPGKILDFLTIPIFRWHCPCVSDHMYLCFYCSRWSDVYGLPWQNPWFSDNTHFLLTLSLRFWPHVFLFYCSRGSGLGDLGNKWHIRPGRPGSGALAA